METLLEKGFCETDAGTYRYRTSHYTVLAWENHWWYFLRSEWGDPMESESLTFRKSEMTLEQFLLRVSEEEKILYQYYLANNESQATM